MDAIEPVYGTATLLIIAAVAVALLLFLIMKVKLHAFVSLVLVSLLTAVAAGIPHRRRTQCIAVRVRRHPRLGRPSCRLRGNAGATPRAHRRRASVGRH